MIQFLNNNNITDVGLNLLLKELYCTCEGQKNKEIPKFKNIYLSSNKLTENAVKFFNDVNECKCNVNNSNIFVNLKLISLESNGISEDKKKTLKGLDVKELVKVFKRVYPKVLIKY